ncbi:putative B3 domain-containing protein Os04g0346900 [Setaria italica]|uniref:putative B3 domain-containing protein Os04g0346900 n=1 Tax=Setaria italica TaxID=4555 RepID=UPI000BE58E5A|nr:putative B3 domain-containing protein Os04g0346900 [Setaria italica]
MSLLSYQVSTLPDIEEQQEAPSASIQKQQEAAFASIQKQQRAPSASIQKQQEAPSASIQKQQRAPSASIRKQQEAQPASIQKQYDNNLPSSNGEKESQSPTASWNQTSFKIAPPSSIEKQINANTLKNHIVLPKAFCDGIGLREHCAITLKTSRNGSESWQSFPAAFCNAIGLREACTVTLKTSLSSTSSWQVRVLPYKDTSHQVGSGWKSFCEENMIKEGDLCTFNVIEMMLWHVIIDRC